MSLAPQERDNLFSAAMTAVANGDRSGAASALLHLAERAYEESARVRPDQARAFLSDAQRALSIRKQLLEPACGEDRVLGKDGERVPPGRAAQDVTGSKWELRERPKERFTDVAGLAEVKAQLDDLAIKPFLHQAIYARFRRDVSGGILMYGPPGNGKTFIARALAGEIGAAFFVADPASVRNEYVGRTEKAVKELFDNARQHDRAVVFIDEADGLLLHANHSQPVKAVQQFNMELDGIVKHRTKILTLLATNKPWLITDSVLRPPRVSSRVYVGLPDAEAREEILRLKLRGVPISDDVDLEGIANVTDGYSGADMTNVVEEAKQLAINRQIADKALQVVTMQDLTGAADGVSPSTNLVQLKRLQRYPDSGGEAQ